MTKRFRFKFGRGSWFKKIFFNQSPAEPVETPIQEENEVEDESEEEDEYDGYVSTDDEDYINTYEAFITRKNNDPPPPKRRSRSGAFSRPHSDYPVYIPNAGSSSSAGNSGSRNTLTLDQATERYRVSNVRPTSYLVPGTRAGFYKVLDGEPSGPNNKPHRRPWPNSNDDTDRANTFSAYEAGPSRQPDMKFQSAHSRRRAQQKAAKAQDDTDTDTTLHQKRSFAQSFKSFFTCGLASRKPRAKKKSVTFVLPGENPNRFSRIYSRAGLGAFWNKVKNFKFSAPPEVVEPAVTPRRPARKVFVPAFEVIRSSEFGEALEPTPEQLYKPVDTVNPTTGVPEIGLFRLIVGRRERSP